jgi:hypothetical protein
MDLDYIYVQSCREFNLVMQGGSQFSTESSVEITTSWSTVPVG